MKKITLSTDLTPLRTVDPNLVSYNIEMTEITGGTFWKAYTPGQIAGSEDFVISGNLGDFTTMGDLMQYYPPINLYDEKLRRHVKALSPAWVRVSGSWATKTYYDLDNTANGNVPYGYAAVLTREQWVGLLDFVKFTEGKLLISVSNCIGDHPEGGPLDLTQTRKIFDFSHEYGVDIAAAEFMNEPNMLEFSGAPQGYTASDFARDQDIFFRWVRENYPDCLLVGPCSLGDGAMGKADMKSIGAGIGSLMELASTEELMEKAEIMPDVFSYHYYNGVSERLASIAPDAHWDGHEAHTDEYLAVADLNARVYAPLRDRYVPGGQMWVTESGDAGGGGNTWASSYLDVFRTLNELSSFSAVTDGIIFHNTLASSDYGFLSHGSFEPRPNYFAVLLWKTLMGDTVFDCKYDPHIYCHSRKDGKEGCVYLVINNSLTEEIELTLPKDGEVYSLTADELRSSSIKLNGVKLNSLTDFSPANCTSGTLTLPPASNTFIVL